MGARKKVVASDEQTELAVEEDVIEVSEDERPTESDQVEAIIKYLRGKAQPDIDRASVVIEAERVGRVQKEVAALEAALASKRQALEALTGTTGQIYQDDTGRSFRSTRSPSRSASDAPTVDQVVAFLKNAGATSFESGRGKGEIMSHLDCTVSQWQKVINEALASKRVKKEGNLRGTLYYITRTA